MLPTVAEILAMDVVRAGRPTLVAGADAETNPVRWVHVSELADIASLLRGGELVLTTGVALPEDVDDLAEYVAALARVGAAGLVVELGRRFRRLPPTMVAAARRHHLPLVALQREVRFVTVTEAVHSRIIDDQLAELRRSETLHATFTELSLEGASLVEIVRHVARLARVPAVLENVAHQVIFMDPADRPPDEVLDRWEQRSRATVVAERVGHSEATGLLVCLLGTRGQDWGRLVLVCEEAPTGWHRMLVERGATALALGRRVDDVPGTRHREAHDTLLSALLDRQAPEREVVARASAVGVPMAGRYLTGLTVRLAEADAGRIDVGAAAGALADAVGRSARNAGVPALVAVLGEADVSALLATPSATDAARFVDRVATDLAGFYAGRVVIGVGATSRRVADARRSILESHEVVDVAGGLAARPAFRLQDLGLRGLLHVLRDDPRLQRFAEERLDGLLRADAGERDRLFAALAAILRAGGNKKAAAELAHISRSVLYERIQRLQQVLGVDLDDAEDVTALHVAVLALETFRGTGATPVPGRDTTPLRGTGPAASRRTGPATGDPPDERSTR